MNFGRDVIKKIKENTPKKSIIPGNIKDEVRVIEANEAIGKRETAKAGETDRKFLDTLVSLSAVLKERKRLKGLDEEESKK